MQVRSENGKSVPRKAGGGETPDATGEESVTIMDSKGSLFVAERFDGVLAGGLEGGPEAEDESDRGRDAEA